MNEIENFLEPYPAEIRSLFAALSILVKRTVPGVDESYNRGWQLVSYKRPVGSGSRFFLSITPYTDHIRLGFVRGSLMADEAGLLHGSGSWLRYLVLKDRTDIQPDLLIDYIREASDITALSSDQKAALALQRDAERDDARPWR